VADQAKGMKSTQFLGNCVSAFLAGDESDTHRGGEN
jgi:hypothetical protein